MCQDTFPADVAKFTSERNGKSFFLMWDSVKTGKVLRELKGGLLSMEELKAPHGQPQFNKEGGTQPRY